MGKELKEWLDEFVDNGANPKDVTNWPEEAGGEAKTTLEITSEDITVEDDKIVFNRDIAHEIMSMNKRIKVDASIIDPTVAQGQLIGIFTPRAITNYSSIQEGITVYEYSTTNLLLDVYRTTYVEFIWDETNDKLYVDANRPTINEDHIVGFSTESADGIRLTTNPDLRTSSINTLRINNLDTVSISDMPSLLFNANANNELESIEFMQNGYSADFTYTIPKGAKHYVVNELPTTDIDTNGNYYVMTESGDARGYLSTDITNLSQLEYPSTNLNTLRQNPIVNGSDFTKLQVSEAGTNKFRGDFAIKFNIPCTVLITLNPTQPYGSYMYLDVNGVNELFITAGHTYDYTRNFNVGETLYVRGECTSTLHNLYYKLAIQPYTVGGKIPLSTNVDEYINFENLWFKNSGGSTVIANPELSGDEVNLTGLQVGDTKYAVPQGSGGIEYVELNSASGTIEVETFQKLDFGGAYIKYNDIVLIPNGREQSGGGLGGTKTCYFDSTVNNNKYLSCVLTASLPLPPNATVPYTITEVSVGGGETPPLYEHNINLWCTTKTIDINFSYLSTSKTELTIDDILSIYNGKNVGCYGLYSFDGKIGYLNYFSPYNNVIEVHYIAVFNGTATITSEVIAKNNFTITDTVRTIY